MEKLFANFKPYDVQATRREAREEGQFVLVNLFNAFRNFPEKPVKILTIQVYLWVRTGFSMSFIPFSIRAKSDA